MESISRIDRNFAVETSLNIDNIRFYDIQEAPFCLYGVFFENGKYRRMPEKVARTVSDQVYALHTHTAGGRLKFTTDSNFVAIQAVMPTMSRMPHFTLTGSAGFDLYVGKKEKYKATFVPDSKATGGYESVIRFNTAQKREITINFPLYSEVSALRIGLHKDASLEKASDYRCKKPIVYYGSSITQGGCASRPGNSYESIIARGLQADYINLGFSGSAKAEDEMAEYIKSLDMSVFVYDYDHNAPDLAHLEATHKKLFLAVRKAHPNLPIIILSRPKYTLADAEKQRLEIIQNTYTSAISSGDQNTYFIDGPTLMKYAKDDGTVDGDHPNDLGFYSMAKVLTKQLKAIRL